MIILYHLDQMKSNILFLSFFNCWLGRLKKARREHFSCSRHFRIHSKPALSEVRQTRCLFAWLLNPTECGLHPISHNIFQNERYQPTSRCPSSFQLFFLTKNQNTENTQTPMSRTDPVTIADTAPPERPVLEVSAPQRSHRPSWLPSLWKETGRVWRPHTEHRDVQSFS